MSSNRVSKDRTCECGRTFAKYQGLEIHSRSCATEQRRSIVFVDGYAGLRGWDAAIAWRTAGRP